MAFNQAKSSRRKFLKAVAVGGGVTALRASTTAAASGDRPNILWLVSEDNGPFLGCYGDVNANTPNLDALAREGVLYENAIANAAVCAPARSTLITGLYASSMGTHHMRSRNAVPPEIRFFPQYLREAGYYCSNNAKEDYNIAKIPEGTWDDSSNKAHYMNRAPGQPFFSIFNHGVSHESSLHKTDATTVHDPAKMILPPYHPDTPTVRHDWAQYYDRMTTLDRQIGQKLQDLEEAGLAEDTIVFYYADHGGILPRSKRFPYDSGVRVPMIVRFPKKWQHLAPSAPGTHTDRLVSFVDFAPTVLSLAGIETPAQMQGEAFLGPHEKPPRDYVYIFRGRKDERYDESRAVRDKKYKYIRNFMWHIPWGVHINYLYRMPAMREWKQLYDEGGLPPVQRRFFEPKATEELYDLQADPHEVRNLALERGHADTLERMRTACRDWMFEIHDAALLPENEMRERARDTTVYEMLRDKGRYPIEHLYEIAEMANQRRDPDTLPLLRTVLESDPDGAARYWAAVGLLQMGADTIDAATALEQALDDPVADVRCIAAEALCVMGRPEKALEVLEKELHQSSPFVALRAAEALGHIGETARPVLERYTTKKEYDTPYRDEQFAPQDVLRHAMNELDIPLPDAVKQSSY